MFTGRDCQLKCWKIYKHYTMEVNYIILSLISNCVYLHNRKQTLYSLELKALVSTINVEMNSPVLSFHFHNNLQNIKAITTASSKEVMK